MPFTPTKFSTVQDKEWFFQQFQRFVESGFAQRQFTRKFYERLMHTFGHIAHYNQLGFWSEFFTTTADQVRFLDQTLSYPCYGDPAWTYSDVERAIQSWLAEQGLLARLQQQLLAETEAAERQTYERLKDKFKS